MTVIPQRQLRNEVGDVLRRAEAGETFTITVNGRAVAELGPIGVRTAVSGAELTRFFREHPGDASWTAELMAERDRERADNPDPWAS